VQQVYVAAVAAAVCVYVCVCVCVCVLGGRVCTRGISWEDGDMLMALE
jgi:hypothetical protein